MFRMMLTAIVTFTLASMLADAQALDWQAACAGTKRPRVCRRLGTRLGRMKAALECPACGECPPVSSCPTPSLARVFGPDGPIVDPATVSVYGAFQGRQEPCLGGLFSGPVAWTAPGVGTLTVTGACTGTLRAFVPSASLLVGIVPPLVVEGTLHCDCCGDMAIDAQL